MKKNHIIIDTNIILDDKKLNSRDLTKLIKTKKLYDFDIYIPQVVYDELVGNYKISFEKKYNELDRLLDEINKKFSKKTEINKNQILNKLSDSDKFYKKRLDKFISENKIK